MTISHKGQYQSFAHRLISAMKRAGYTKPRAAHGISIQVLANLMTVSEQICRRYLRGDALPDYEKVINIAAILNVSPGWLLFGDQPNMPTTENNTLHINEELLHYILEKSFALYLLAGDNSNDFSNFVLALLKDVSAIDANHDTLKKIIDLAVSSIYSFDERRQKKAI